MKTTWSLLGLACACLLATAGWAAEKPKATAPEKTQAVKTTRDVWPPETLSGKIMMIDPAKNLLIVTGPSGVPFDLVVTHATKIESGNKKLTLDALGKDLQKNISVRFVPERSGDIARSVQVG